MTGEEYDYEHNFNRHYPDPVAWRWGWLLWLQSIWRNWAWRHTRSRSHRSCRAVARWSSPRREPWPTLTDGSTCLRCRDAKIKLQIIAPRGSRQWNTKQRRRAVYALKTRAPAAVGGKIAHRAERVRRSRNRWRAARKPSAPPPPERWIRRRRISNCCERISTASKRRSRGSFPRPAAKRRSRRGTSLPT